MGSAASSAGQLPVVVVSARGILAPSFLTGRWIKDGAFGLKEGTVRRLLEICLTGLVAARLHPLRSTVSCIALVAVLLPFLVGVAVSQGIEAEAEASARFGADLYVTGSQFGRPVPIPLA